MSTTEKTQNLTWTGDSTQRTAGRWIIQRHWNEENRDYSWGLYVRFRAADGLTYSRFVEDGFKSQKKAGEYADRHLLWDHQEAIRKNRVVAALRAQQKIREGAKAPTQAPLGTDTIHPWPEVDSLTGYQCGRWFTKYQPSGKWSTTQVHSDRVWGGETSLTTVDRYLDVVALFNRWREFDHADALEIEAQRQDAIDLVGSTKAKVDNLACKIAAERRVLRSLLDECDACLVKVANRREVIDDLVDAKAFILDEFAQTFGKASS